MAGEMNLNVWLRTLTFAIVCSNGGHMARDALAALAVGGMLGMELERAARARLQRRAVALQADGVPGQTQVRLVVGPVHVVAGGALHTLQVHLALHVVVALHAVLVRRSFGPMRERRRPQLVFFELPDVGQASAGLVADRPVVVAPLNRIRPRLSLGVALNAHIVGANRSSLAGLTMDARSRPDMLTASAMASLAADVPLRHRSGLDVVIHRMTAVAQRPRRPLHLIVRVVLVHQSVPGRGEYGRHVLFWTSHCAGKTK